MRAKSILLGLGLAAGLALQSGAAQAASLSSPYGTAAVNVYVGNIGTSPYAFYIRKSDGNCTATQIGSGSALYDNYIVNGGSGDDSMHIVWANETICGNSVTPPTYGGYYLDLYGGSGKDTVWNMETSADTYVYGESGADYLLTRRSDGVAYGGTEGDTILGWGNGTSEILMGEGGDDCLADANASASTFDCGGHSSHDYKASGYYPVSVKVVAASI